MYIAQMLWEKAPEAARAHCMHLRQLGHQVTPFQAGEAIPQKAEIVFTNGPCGSLVPLAKQLLAISAANRPPLALWMSEQFWNPYIPHWLGRIVSDGRLWVEQLAHRQAADGQWQLRPGWQSIANKAYRFLYFGQLRWMQEANVLKCLGIGSDWTVKFLRANGIKAIVAHNGYTPAWGQKRQERRDIPVLWIGKAGSRRRQQLLEHLQQEFRQRNIDLLVVDGVSHPYVFGQERTELLNRTQIVLNVLRQPWDNNYLRYLLAMSNGAMVVSEPTFPHAPFRHGEHLVVTPINQMVATICDYLQNIKERETIVNTAYNFITTEFTMERGLKQILANIN